MYQILRIQMPTLKELQRMGTWLLFGLRYVVNRYGISREEMCFPRVATNWSRPEWQRENPN